MDLDDTIYAYDPCNKAAFDACSKFALETYSIEPEIFKTHWDNGRKRVHTDLNSQGSSHSRLLYAQKLSESFFGFTHPRFAIEIEEMYWNTFLETMKWNQSIKTILEEAKGVGMEMCIVTDLTAHIQLRKWEKLQLSSYFKYLISSEEAGIEKPHPKMFELALEKLALKPEEVLMFGDSARKDVEGAQALGIKSYLVKDGEIINV